MENTVISDSWRGPSLHCVLALVLPVLSRKRGSEQKPGMVMLPTTAAFIRDLHEFRGTA